MRTLPGLIALALLLGTVGAALTGLLAAGVSFSLPPLAYLKGVLGFTLLQATLSTLLSLMLGGAAALALARRRNFPGRSLLVGAMNLASVLPAIVAVFGIVAVYGRSGWAGQLASLAGIETGSWLYGLPGILIAHVFFNAPLAARVFLAALNAIPAAHWRLAAQLGMKPYDIFRLVDRAVLLREATGVAALIFLLCFTSFAIVLALGGGPGAATLEVAIYEAVRFEADLGRAAALAGLQILICGTLVLAMARGTRRGGESAAVGAPVLRPDAASARMRLIDMLVLCCMALLVLAPLAAMVVSGLASLGALLTAEVRDALLTSLGIGGAAGALAVALALALGGLSAHVRLGLRRPSLADALGLVGLVIVIVPPFALITGLFVLLRRGFDPADLAVPAIILINGLMALPFALRQVEPPLMLAAERHGRLAESLGIAGLDRLRLVDWPLLRRPLLDAFVVATALSLGDLGVASFFGGSVTTLPLLLYQHLGAYRVDEAAAVALLLAALVFCLFLLADRLSGDRHA